MSSTLPNTSATSLPVVSAVAAKKILERFELKEPFVDKICFLIENHDKPITTNEIVHDYELYETLFHIQECDALAHNPDYLEKRINYINETDEKFRSFGR